MRIIAQQSRQQKRKLRRLIHKEREAGMKTRLSIILHLAEGQGPAAVARALHIARSTVYRVAERFRDGASPGSRIDAKTTAARSSMTRSCSNCGRSWPSGPRTSAGRARRGRRKCWR
jgi:DNA invertase Pin-like site-specific DNA recombinase